MRISDEMVEAFKARWYRETLPDMDEDIRATLTEVLVAGGFTEEERAAFDGDIPPFATSVTIPIRVRLVGPWEPKT